MITWADKLAVVWKGPSWFPGAPRLGLDEFKIKVRDNLRVCICKTVFNIYKVK